jgi:lipopolysaccharide transport system ATP-binding protein
MSTPVISVENLSKKYLLSRRAGQRGVHSYTALRDIIGRELRNFGRKALDFALGGQVVHGDEVEEFWALKDISFEVNEGEVVGIIGRNGAGKSTLLKILSRITEPTSGRVTLRGRVASLLEVGTGFHPELSGRENIFLNGTILGMRRAEIRRKFDEIVAFAEIEKFLDTPVKRYSSGMYVRLAFAVAAHLESEILIVDEVLAVGDAEFQKKCLGKMHEVSDSGRTVLFVSHNATAVRHLCKTVIVLDKSRVIFSGKQDDALDFYHSNTALSKNPVSSFTLRHQTQDLRLLSVKTLPSSIKCGHRISIETRWTVSKPMRIAIECFLKDKYQHPIASYGTGISSGYELELDIGEHDILIEFPPLALAEGNYTIDIAAGKTNTEFYVYADDAALLDVYESDPLGSGFKFIQGNGAMFLDCNVRCRARRHVLAAGTSNAVAGDAG